MEGPWCRDRTVRVCWEEEEEEGAERREEVGAREGCRARKATKG